MWTKGQHWYDRRRAWDTYGNSSICSMQADKETILYKFLAWQYMNTWKKGLVIGRHKTTIWHSGVFNWWKHWKRCGSYLLHDGRHFDPWKEKVICHFPVTWDRTLSLQHSWYHALLCKTLINNEHLSTIIRAQGLKRKHRLYRPPS